MIGLIKPVVLPLLCVLTAGPTRDMRYVPGLSGPLWMARSEYLKNRVPYVKLFTVSNKNTFSHKTRVATKDPDGFGDILS